MRLNCCWLTGIFIKHTKLVTFFCLEHRRKSRHSFKLGAWRTVKTRACLLRFSALNTPRHEPPLQTSSSPIPGCQYGLLQHCKLYLSAKVNLPHKLHIFGHFLAIKSRLVEHISWLRLLPHSLSKLSQSP